MQNLLKYFDSSKTEAGCDEAGRGCLAGPVVAAAVILPENFNHPFLNDSKKLTDKKRKELREIIEKQSVDYAIAFVDHEEIDKINILNASFKAMHLALDKLKTRPNSLLIDGNRFHQYRDIPHHCMIKGDGRFCSIAAASILAKTYRDEYMEEIHNEYPYYGWDRNKGYPTKKHREGIELKGASPYHRKSFTLLKQPELGLEFK